MANKYLEKIAMSEAFVAKRLKNATPKMLEVFGKRIASKPPVVNSKTGYSPRGVVASAIMEKMAARWKDELVAKGHLQDVGTTSNAALRSGMGLGNAGTGVVANGGSKFIKPQAPSLMNRATGGLFGTSGSKGKMVNMGGLSGDKLAEGPGIAQRLADHKAGIARKGETVVMGAKAGLTAASAKAVAAPAPAAGSRLMGHIQKGMKFVKGNPIKTAVGVGAAGLGLLAMKHKNQEPQY